jgi:sugar transferase (PEP-CTERM/EpsH1 system associated)
MKILFLSAWFPYPPDNGSKIRIYNLLQGLAQHHDVTLLCFTDENDVNVANPVLNTLCRHVQVIPRKPFEPESSRARLGFLSLKPRAVVDTFSRELAQRVKQLILHGDFDLVVASEIKVAAYGQYFQGVPALLDELQVGVLYEQFARADSAWRRFRYRLTWAKHRRYLARLLRHFRACTVVSQRERQLLTNAVGNGQSIEIIPNCVDVESYHDVQEKPQPNTLIFTGSFTYFPNHEAMVWFLRHVYPRLQAQVPEVRLVITGDHADRPLPAADNVELTGYVDDVRPLIASSWVSLAPIFVGGGTRLKILEAMALGTPVVATPKGAEGLQMENGQHILIADTAEAFAQATIRLLQDVELRRQLARNAYQLVRQQYDWKAVMPRFLNLVERIAHA